MSPTERTFPVKTPLHDAWTLRPLEGPLPADLADLGSRPVPATVPGCVHTDLLAADLIPDPYLDENERLLEWIGHTSWRYSTTFRAAAAAQGERVDLDFEGLDTVATVSLNGTVLGSTANMHRSHRFDVRGVLVDGDNEMTVDFAAQTDATEQASQDLGPRPHVNRYPFNGIRKMACNFGWDWGPELVTAGIWRPVTLHRWTTARLAAVRPLVGVDGTTGTVEVHVDVELASGGYPVRVAADIAGQEAEAEVGPDGTAVLRLEVTDASLWWPRGHGQQPLYPVRVRLLADDAELETWERRVGFRTVTLDTTPDATGTPFTFVVNGKPILVRGANWIPDDCFPSRIDRARYERSIANATDSGMNLLRVWGGGIYESEDFYEICDRDGLMVWQDFLFACAAYAEEEPLRGEVVAEAREAVTRLTPHPSLVLWNGCNENIWGHEDWGWKETLADLTWGMGYYTEVLPAIVAELDPARPYSAGSPWSLDTSRHPNDPDHGTMHIWDVWNQVDYTVYRDYVPRLASEFGYQGPPAWSTLTRAVHDQPLRPDSPGVLLHQKAEDGNAKLTRGLEPHLAVPHDMEDWHWAMSMHQARAVAFGVEHFRSWAPRCAGTIVWQLNDCWPVTSWAAVDGDGRRKPLWYALKHVYADRLLTVQPREGALAVVAVNDSDQPWTGSLAATRTALDGSVLAKETLALEVAARSTTALELPAALTAAGDTAAEVLVVDGAGARALWFFAEDKDLALAAGLEARAERTDDGYAVHVTARSLQRDVTVLADKVDPAAVVDDAVVTVLAGEAATFRIRSSVDVDPQVFLAPAVLRSTNQLVGG
jgi:beta-mannosidase